MDQLERYLAFRALAADPETPVRRASRRAHRQAVATRRAEYARIVTAREQVLVGTAVEELRRSDVALAG
ncbi:hypothetical protein [Actinotalea fermentans]|uniref:Uncharacterized protein n=1 Tax=Actinotalea fermentans TaxID=43671 RepID=A0A511YYT5_9CELL|nr:hypothetical protein [Actinotalea fermentans]KGM15117.1 hypothetical protein N867_11845 [Actinotalea fermentans ATCC 43279 = JCM 9966 = DSM 3133]GEN80367.1 hypothetical protein AFE02nite_21010 [Actinotalea fermentans]